MSALAAISEDGVTVVFRCAMRMREVYGRPTVLLGWVDETSCEVGCDAVPRVDLAACTRRGRMEILGDDKELGAGLGRRMERERLAVGPAHFTLEVLRGLYLLLTAL